MTDRENHVVRDVAMVVLALASIAILYVQETRDLSDETDRRLLYLDLAIVAIFWFEYLARLRTSSHRRAFVAQNWYELPGMVPILPGMESWGALRLLRLLRILRILRLLGALRRFERFERLLDRFLHQSRLGYVALLAVLVIMASAAVAWAAEPSTFSTYGDAVWWAIVTATTVGYGDYFPRSLAGRLAAVPLMLLGIGLIGILAATLSTFLVERGTRSSETTEGSLTGELERLARLRRSGDLDAREYRTAKARLLRQRPSK